MENNMPKHITNEELSKMQSVDITAVDIESLVDIKDVTIDPELPLEQRIAEYIRKIKNPYCYRDGDVIVKISFADNNISLEERLEDYFSMC